MNENYEQTRGDAFPFGSVVGLSGICERNALSQLESCCRELSEALRAQEELVNAVTSDDFGFNESWQLCDARLKRAVITLVEAPAASLSDLSQKIDHYAAWTDTVEIEDDLAARLSSSLIAECRELLRTQLGSETRSSQTRRAPFVSPSVPSRLNFSFSKVFAGSIRSGSRRSQA